MLMSSISDVDGCCCEWEKSLSIYNFQMTWVGARATKINDFWFDCSAMPNAGV
jgi:hypothetical protein